MDFRESFISGLFEITPRIWEDERGYFFESYQEEQFKEHNIPTKFVQDNQSFSVKGVLRGLHLQKEPYAQAKLVCVMQGSALDVVVDLRKDSPTFGKYDVFHLDTKKNNRVYVPEGFAHGFIALEECVLCYKCSNFYNKAFEGGIIWNDPTLNIDWTIKNPIVSEKDLLLPTFKELVENNI